MTDNDLNTQLDTLNSGYTQADEPPVRRRGRRKKEADVIPTITTEQMSLITDGLFVILEGLTKLPLRTTDEKLKHSFDESAAIVANEYIPADYAKYVPLAQLGLSMTYIVLDAYERKRKIANE